MSKFRIRTARMIKAVAEEAGYKLKGNLHRFIVYTSIWHTHNWRFYFNRASKYWEVSTWQDNGNGENKVPFGRPVHSLRNLANVVDFCTLMTICSRTRARRREV